MIETDSLLLASCLVISMTAIFEVLPFVLLGPARTLVYQIFKCYLTRIIESFECLGCCEMLAWCWAAD